MTDFCGTGKWVKPQTFLDAQGYRLQRFVDLEGEPRAAYEPIADNISYALKLKLVAEGTLISCYRLDTGEKLLIPNELAASLAQETQNRQQAEARAEEERQRAETLVAQLARYREQFGELPEK